jgi:hypothetical protein
VERTWAISRSHTASTANLTAPSSNASIRLVAPSTSSGRAMTRAEPNQDLADHFSTASQPQQAMRALRRHRAAAGDSPGELACRSDDLSSRRRFRGLADTEQSPTSSCRGSSQPSLRPAGSRVR